MNPPTTVADVLRTAAAFIAERGLARFVAPGPNGELDVYGALSMAVYGQPTAWEARDFGDLFDRAWQACADHIDPFPGLWGDQVDRTTDEVVDALRSLATKLDSDATTPPGVTR